MRIRRLILRLVVYYVVASVTLAIALGELAFHPQRIPIDETESAKATAIRFGADLQDVSISASDGTRLQAWFAHPANANRDAVILLHGVGDNRQGMMGFAELFLSKGYSVLLPDSRGQGLSDGTPSYGLKEANDVRNWFGWVADPRAPEVRVRYGRVDGSRHHPTVGQDDAILRSGCRVGFRQLQADCLYPSGANISYGQVARPVCPAPRS